MDRFRRIAYAGFAAGIFMLLVLALAACGSLDGEAKEKATAIETATAPPSSLPPKPRLTAILTRTVQISDDALAPSEPKNLPPTIPPGTATPEPSLTGLPEPATVPISPTMPMPASRGLQSLVQLAMTDLVLRMGADADQIELLEVRSVVWPDGSLGCPQPGKRYTQATVDGMLIRLRVGDEVYDYHSGGTQPPFLCMQGSREPPPSVKGTPVPALTAVPKGTPGAK